MTSASIVPVVLFGGLATRLRPRSRKSHPKQFVPLIVNKSLLRPTAERLTIAAKCASGTLLCVSDEATSFLEANDVRPFRMGGDLELESSDRNISAAMALAGLDTEAGGGNSLRPFCPAEHCITYATAFAAVVQLREAAASGAIVTFGVMACFSTTACGFIRQGAAQADGCCAVARFIELNSSSPTPTRLCCCKALCFGTQAFFSPDPACCYRHWAYTQLPSWPTATPPWPRYPWKPRPVRACALCGRAKRASWPAARKASTWASAPRSSVLGIHSGASLSLQKHPHRAENRVAVQGTA